MPPGTQSGQRFRLRGRGAPSLRTGSAAISSIEMRMMLPPLLDERSKELLREFGMINGSAYVRPAAGVAVDSSARPGSPGAV